ncbi:RNA-binding protein 14 [Merluccius polli]|uniref:RNA-binding protein 14 n=1 Tax=Merluccius polli TaxID=89951 RepID=A0AA47N704_MERPO|nr:RNA-binding protein 14 [Merluccius polli]
MSDNVKLFVGNLPLDATHEELNKLFSPHGEVNTCSLLRQYAFITLKGEGAADRAIRHLDGKEYRGRPLVVEESRARPPNSTKVFVGNLSSTCTADDLHGLFQSFGRVLDCDKVKARLCSNAGYAFVHMERKEEALLAIEGLNGTMYKGRQLSVELSKAQPLINQLASMDAANLAASMAAGGPREGLLPRPATSLEHHQSQAAILAAAAAAAAGLPIQVQQSVHNSFYNTTSFDPTYTALKGLTSTKSADGVNPAIYGALASQVYGSVADQVYDEVANHDTTAVEVEPQTSTDPTALFEAARAKFFQQGQKVLAEQQAGRKAGTTTASERDRSPIRANRAPLLPDPVPGSMAQVRPKRRALLPTPPGGPEPPTATTTPAAAEGAADPIARCYAEYYQQMQQYQQYQQYQQQYQYLQYAYTNPPPPPPPPPPGPPAAPGQAAAAGYPQSSAPATAPPGTAYGSATTYGAPVSYDANSAGYGPPGTYDATAAGTYDATAAGYAAAGAYDAYGTAGAYPAAGNYSASRPYEQTPAHGQTQRHEYPYHTPEPPYR